MNIEKIREEFESWYSASHLWAPEETPLARSEGGSYFAVAVSGKWRAWQASRAALVIELPKSNQLYALDNEPFIYTAEILKVIEAAGVKVKS